MKKYAGLLAVLLVLALMLCLFPTAALADPPEGEEPTGEATETEAPTEETDGEEEPTATEEPAAQEDPAAEETPAAEEPQEESPAEEIPAETESDAPAPVIVAQGETYYAVDGETVYNNGGLVYANGGLIYNNGGEVYLNDGTVYNNNGTVYANAGTVYNNNGTVFSNGALIHTFADDDVQESHIFGLHRVTMEEETAMLAEIEGLIDGEYLGKDDVLTITPHEGYAIVFAETTSGTLTENEDGSYSLSGVETDAALTLTFQPAAPVFDLESGTYAQEQLLTITAPEGTEVYYTTDGNEPREDNSVLYDGPIVLKEGVTVTAVAIAKGAEPSETVRADYAFVTVTAPVFEDAEEGYEPIEAQAFAVECRGGVDAEIESVRLEGENAKSFVLSTEEGGTVKAGAVDESTWTLNPAEALAKGSYKVTVLFTLTSGEAVELEITFTVK